MRASPERTWTAVRERGDTRFKRLRTSDDELPPSSRPGFGLSIRTCGGPDLSGADGASYEPLKAVENNLAVDATGFEHSRSLDVQD